MQTAEGKGMSNLLSGYVDTKPRLGKPRYNLVFIKMSNSAQFCLNSLRYFRATVALEDVSVREMRVTKGEAEKEVRWSVCLLRNLHHSLPPFLPPCLPPSARRFQPGSKL